VQRELEGKFVADQAEVDTAAAALLKQSPGLAIDYLTEYSVRAGDETVSRWRKLGEFLVYKYLDGNVKDELGNVKHPGYPESWYRKLAEATGDRLQMRKLEREKAEAAAKEAEEAAQREKTVQAITTLLSSRGLEPTAAVRTQLGECKDLKKLQGWLVRAATAETVEKVVAEN